MNVGEHCRRGVISVADSADMVTAARMMRDQHVGLLAVHRQDDEIRRVIGVLTDRDIVMQVTATGRDPRAVKVQDVMIRQPLIANEQDEMRDVLQVMRLAGIRRVPVVDARGAPAGILALDDAIELITGLLCDISGSIHSERHHEWRGRSEHGESGEPSDAFDAINATASSPRGSRLPSPARR